MRFPWASDLDYCKAYTDSRQIQLTGLQQATVEEIGRELHRISKRYRGEGYKTVGTYIGLNLLVKSEYNLAGAFERNTFFVEGISGLKYCCGVSGALPLGFKAAAEYPQTTLDGITRLIARQKDNVARLESEIPTLQQVLERRWSKSAELEALKRECEALQRRIDESLRQTESTAVAEVAA